MKGNSINNWFYFKSGISVRGGNLYLLVTVFKTPIPLFTLSLSKTPYRSVHVEYLDVDLRVLLK